MNDEKQGSLDISDSLRSFDFLRGVPEQSLRELSQFGREVEFPAGSVIFRSQEPALHCYLILDGRVSLEICSAPVGCAQIMTTGKGDLLGWSAFLGESRLTATARTLMPVRAIELDGVKIAQWCEMHPETGYHFMRRVALTLAKRLTATRLQLLDIYHRDPHHVE